MAISIYPASSDVDSPFEQPASSLDRKEAESRDNSPVIRTARTFAEIEDLREVWSLWCNDPDADLDFCLAHARSRPEFVRSHVIVISRGGRPDCLLVGAVERGRLRLKIGYATVFEPFVSQLVLVRGGLLGNATRENCQLLAEELRRFLQGHEVDSVKLAGASQDSPLSEALKTEFNCFRRGHFTLFHEHRWIELPESFDEFLKGMSRKHRHEFRRHKKKLSDHCSGSAQIHCFRRQSELAELVREVEAISTKTYQRAMGVGFRPEAEILEFLQAAARKGTLRGCVLSIHGQPCAFFIGNEYKDTFYGNFMGFDPAFGKYSPGLLVLMHCIEECFDPATRSSRFDLGWGDREFKRIICNQSRLDGSQYLYSFSWAGMKLNVLRSTTSLIDLLARKLLARSNFLEGLKKAWQDRQVWIQATKSRFHPPNMQMASSGISRHHDSN